MQKTTVTYTNKNILISPRKLRLMARQLVGQSPAKLLESLKLTNSKSARILVKSIKNVIADAKHNFKLDPNSLKIDTAQVDEGMKLKRMDRSHGSRFARGVIIKRHSRLKLTVSGLPEVAKSSETPKKVTKLPAKAPKKS